MSIGIDVFEKYNPVTWNDLQDHGVRNVYVKLSDGRGPASIHGDGYVSSAKGVGMMVGGYHYAEGADTPEANADAFASELVRLNANQLAPALDYEDKSLLTSGLDAAAWIVRFFNRLKVQLPKLTRVVLYASGALLETIMSHIVHTPSYTILIWDAEYGPNDGKEHPIVHYTGKVAIHQYTSAGTIGTFKGDLDDFEADVRETIPTEEPFMGATINQQDWDALIWRVAALVNGSVTVTGGPTKGEHVVPNVSEVALSGAVAALTKLVSASQGLSVADVQTAVSTAVAEEMSKVVKVELVDPPATP